MSDESNVEVEVNLESDPEPTSEATPVVVVEDSGGEPAVESVVALVEHVEEDTPKWVDNAVEHERLSNRLAALEAAQVVEAAEEVAEAIAEVEAEAEAEPEAEIEIDIPPVDEPEEMPGRSKWDYFAEAHAE